MESSPFTFSNRHNDFEIKSRIDHDLYFEVELLCDTTKEVIAGLKDKQKYVLANTYMYQCVFLIDAVLDYIRNQQKTTVHFIQSEDESTYEACRKLHIRQISASHTKLHDAFDKFKEAVSFIFPKERYPEYLFRLKAKMSFLEMVMTDLFHLEKVKLIPEKVIESPNALKFGNIVMN